MNERIRELAKQTGYIWHASGDPQIYEFTPEKLEKFAESRLRKSGERGERQTGNIVAAAFRHDTSRELDPHLQTPPYADGDISEGVSALHTTVSTRKFDRRVTGLRPWRECTHGDQEGNLQVREAG